jgi:hypothetical protein
MTTSQQMISQLDQTRVTDPNEQGYPVKRAEENEKESMWEAIR